MILRTRFKKDIVCEFLPPNRPSNRVIIFCKGMPGLPRFPQVLEFWAKKGFWVFLPRYRGTWESGGEFLKQSPEKDILDVIDGISKGFTDLWSGKKFRLPVTSSSYTLCIFGGSFGGPAAILLSRDPRVTKAVAFAPVIDWAAPSKDEPMDRLGAFIPKGFGNCYRFSKKNWLRLSRNEFYSPMSLISSPPLQRGEKRIHGASQDLEHSSANAKGVQLRYGGLRGGGKTSANNFDGSKLLIFHAKDDRSVPYSYTKKFAAKTGAKLITLRTGGHFGFSRSIEPKIYKEIRKFLS